jgi:streptogramin lyase
MADGQTLFVNTFYCGLYQIHDYASDDPSFKHVYTFPIDDESGEQRLCALPVTAGNYWVQTVPARSSLIAIDLSDPKNVQEVSTVDLGSGRRPHWISIEPNERRIVVTGFGELRNSVMMVKLNKSDGSLSVDRNFGENGVVDFGRTSWPHGENGAAVPHGSVFSVPDVDQ